MALNHNILLETGTNEFEVVEFLIKTDISYHFCINVAKVREVIRLPEVVQVPNAHEAVIGTAHIRRSLVPIIDLAYWLRLRPKTVNPDCKVIVTYFNHVNNGFMVDAVVRIHRINWSDIKDYTAVADSQMVDAVLGVVNIDNRMVQLLDFESIVADINPNLKMNDIKIDLSLKGDRSKYNVYFAEDSPIIRRLLVKSFTEAGYNVSAFENGAKLLKAVEQKVPNIIVTDLEMPVTSGDYVVRKIREQIGPSKLPIIVFSSMASKENESKLLRIGANKFIGKPDLSLLISLVDEYLLRG